MFNWLGNLFPYSDLHSLNLDWILTKMKETAAQAAKAIADSANALAQVIEAKTAAQDAQTAAQNAQTAANNAQTAADNAATSAENAVTVAQAAKSAAQTAQNTANTAQSAAQTAQSTAQTAQSAAETAQSAAQTAQSAAQTAQSAANNALSKFPVTSENIANNAVITDKIADNAVSVDKIRARAITKDKIANGAVTNEKLANNSFYVAFGSYSELSQISATEINAGGGVFDFKRAATRAAIFTASGYSSYTAGSDRHNLNMYSVPFILQTADSKITVPVILADFNTATQEIINYNGSLTITISNGGKDVHGLITFSEQLPLGSDIDIQYGIASLGARPD